MSILQLRDRETEILEQFGLGILRAVWFEDFWKAAEEPLSKVRDFLDADAIEVFLAEPDGEDLLMTACLSSDIDVFLEKVRFKKGQGFPGIVYNSKAPLKTEDLVSANQYLRKSVTDRGYHSYYCVPIEVTGKVLGTVHLAWVSGSPNWDDVERLLPEIAKMVGTALLARRGTLELATRKEIERAERGKDDPLYDFLTLMIKRTGSSRGVLLYLDENCRITRVVRQGEIDWNCISIQEGVDFLCSALRKGNTSICDPLKPSARASECPLDEIVDKTRYCIPLILSQRLIAAVLLERDQPSETIATRGLPELLWSVQSVSYLLSEFLRKQSTTITTPKVNPSSHHQVSKPLLLRCLGAFKIIHKGDEIPFSRIRRRKAIELLRVLAVHSDSPLEMVQIAEWLWPGLTEKQATNRFHVTLHSLRKTLGDYSEEDFILSEHRLYRLNTDRVEVDLAKFKHHIETARSHLRDNQTESAIEDFETATRLYTGDLFTDDLYAEWSFLYRVRYRNEFVEVLENLIKCYREIGDSDSVLRILTKAVDWEPFREDLQQQLIRVLIDTGRIAEAGTRCTNCLRLVREELGIEPLPETLLLARELGLEK